MKRSIFALFFVGLIGATHAFSQAPPPTVDDKTAVLSVITRLFDEMSAANQAGILASGLPSNQLVGIIRMRDGKNRIDIITADAFSKFFTKPGAVEEIMYAPNVEISGDWAMVWGRYVFFADGKLSHCGINQFNLVRTPDAGWKIANGASTIDRTDCSEKEKAMKPRKPAAPASK